MLSSRRAIGLTKAFKHVRQKFLADSLTRVRNTYVNGAAALRYLYANTPATVRKLHCIRQQIPNHLLQPVRIAGDHRRRRVEVSFDPDSLRISRGPHNVDGIFNYGHDFQRLKLEIEIAGDDARHVENVVDNLCLRLRVAPDSFNCLLHRFVIESAAFQHSGPAEYRCEGSAQLV